MTASTTICESRVFTAAELDRLAAISDGLAGADAAIPADARSGCRAVPEMLLYAALWALIRRRFPDAVQESQDLVFRAPADPGARMRLELEVLGSPTPDQRDLALRVVAGDGGGGSILEGRSRIRLTGGDGR